MTSVSPISSASRFGPAARNGRIQHLMSMISLTLIRIGTSGGRDSDGRVACKVAPGRSVAQAESPTRPPSAIVPRKTSLRLNPSEPYMRSSPRLRRNICCLFMTGWQWAVADNFAPAKMP